MIAVAVALAGAVGAPLRYLLDALVQDRLRRVFPWGTLLINVSGSVALGAITGAALYHAFPAVPKTVLGTGFCSAYTTFSTFSYETNRLAEEGSRREAAANVAGSVLGCLLGAAAGVAIGAAL